MTHTALILVDIQNDYFDGGLMPLPHIHKAAQTAARVLEFARTEGWKVVHVRHIAGSDSAPFFRPGTEGSELNAMVLPYPGETVVRKVRPNSFFGTDLEEVLRTSEIDHVVVCGAMSQMCIDATVRAAVDLGFKATVIDDACAAADVRHGSVEVSAQQVHAAIMAPLSASYASVVTADAIVGS